MLTTYQILLIMHELSAVNLNVAPRGRGGKGEDGNSHLFISIFLTILIASLFISSVSCRKNLLRASCGPSSVQDSVGDPQGVARSTRHHFHPQGAHHLKGRHFHAVCTYLVRHWALQQLRQGKSGGWMYTLL